MLVLLGAGIAAASQTLPLRLVHDSGEDYCDRVRGSFERTGRLARELAAVLDGMGGEGIDVIAGRLAGVRDGLQQEALALSIIAVPPGADEARARGTAVIGLLLEIADPALVESAEGEREELALWLHEQFVAARTEARAATAALRQGDGGCLNRRVARDSMRLLNRQQDH